MIKNIFTIFLSLSLAFSPAISFAEKTSKAKTQSEQALQSEFDKTIYDLKHFDDVLKDMDDIYERVAPKGYSKAIVLELNRRLVGAEKLISKILLDTKLSNEKKDELLSQLVPEFGKAWYKVYYVRGEDTQNDPRARLYANHPEVKEIADQLQKATVGSNEWSDLQQDMISTLDGLQANGVTADKGNLKVRFLRSVRNIGRGAKDIVMEAVMDFKALFFFRTTAKMESVWMPFSRAYQDSAARDGIRTIADLTLNALPKVENDELYDTQRNFWMKQLVKVINLRSDRLRAQRTMTYFYFGLAVWGFGQPFYDLVGGISGWSEHSNFVSACIYGAAWAFIGAIKLSSYSDRIVIMTKEVLELLRDNKPLDEKTLTDLQKRTIFDRVKKIWSKNMCESALTQSGQNEESNSENAKNKDQDKNNEKEAG